MGKKVIPNLVPMVNSWFGENYHFNGVVRYIMGCLGEMTLADYSLSAGITGDIFVQAYALSGFKQDSPSGYYLGLYNFTSVFNKLGYAAEAFSEDELQSNREYFLNKIHASIDRGIPVVWYRRGPTAAIVGYESDGNTLLYLSDHKTEPERVVLDKDYFQNTHKDKYGWIVAGKKICDVSMKRIYRDVIMQLPKLLTLKTDDFAFGAEAFRAWADSIESGKLDDMKPEEFDGQFFAHGIYVLNVATNSGGCQSFFEKAQEMNPEFAFLEDVRRQYRITNYLWNGGYWIKDVFSPEQREEMKRLYGEDTLEKLGGGFDCKLETLQDKKKRALITKQIRRFADCMDEVVRILNEHLPAA